MGFKRTPEGRVFFQGDDEPTQNEDRSRFTRPSSQTANDMPPRPRDHAQKPNPLTSRADPGQMQIVALLKSLNERLKTTQSERDKMMKELESYRSQIEDLEDKASRNERMTLDLEHQLHVKKQVSEKPDEKAIEAERIAKETLKELEATRKALAEMESRQREQTDSLSDKLIKSSTNYAALARRLKDTEERQLTLDEKVESAVAQQTKILRKVDKAIEDRARFMRKIERIEETVLQTRDSLNAKAMVLLTEQGASAQAPVETIDPKSRETLDAIKGATAQAEKKSDTFVKQKSGESFDDKSSATQTIIVALAVLAIGITGGLIWSTMKKPETASNLDFVAQEEAAQTFVPDNAQNIAQDNEWQTVERPSEGALGESTQAQPMSDLEWLIDNTQNGQEQAQPEAQPQEEVNQIQSFEEEAEPQLEEPAAEQEIAAAAEPQEQPKPVYDPTNDLGAIDLQNEEQVAALLEDNPQKLAAQLNAIEPQKAVSVEETQLKPVPLQTAQLQSLSTKSESELRNMIKPDSGLPNAIKAIENQAFKGIAEAQHDLAAIYTAGHAGVKQDYKRAAFWFERSAEGGIANAAYNLGVLYHQGLGMDTNVQTALKWYERAAVLGHPEAQYNLGIAYIEGIGVPYDPVKASRYFSAAADRGIMEASYNLGLIYENGLLGNARPEDALMWYKDAADKGSPEAKQALINLTNTLGMRDSEVDRAVQKARTERRDNAGKQSQNNTNATATKTASATPTALSTQSYQNDQALVAQIQEYLMNSGLYPGPADGVRDAMTEDAIRSYQARNAMPANGIPSQTLLSHMMSSE